MPPRSPDRARHYRHDLARAVVAAVLRPAALALSAALPAVRGVRAQRRQAVDAMSVPVSPRSTSVSHDACLSTVVGEGLVHGPGRHLASKVQSGIYQ